MNNNLKRAIVFAYAVFILFCPMAVFAMGGGVVFTAMMGDVPDVLRIYITCIGLTLMLCGTLMMVISVDPATRNRDKNNRK
jgi:TRAP-type C4-dicarboxylate transport system permease small subunit